MKAFHELGFESSSYNKCFLIRKDMMIVVYVDDCGISTDKPEKIDALVNQLKEKGFDLEIEGNFETFLGVKIRQMKDGRYHLLQEGLIKKVLKAAKMTDCSPNHVPAAPTPLGKDPNGEPWSHHPWRYSSIVGMLIYLCTNTCPDISYAVSCAARFNSNPKVSHATAVKTILRYLKKTSDKGLIVNFNGTLDLDCSNLRLHMIQQRLGLVAVLLGLKNLLLPRLQLPNLTAFVCSIIFEDNAGALLLATGQQITNRNRYLSQFYHHFWSFVHRPQDGPPQNNPNGPWHDGKIKVSKITTDKQRADIFTKGLT
ncbi:unnamed protein product [Cylindrotheca closterium]|uniref:Reverse transcriptase Ty1/copia-type domain-containing protein n=1 Tax=Cylindrotheca closterium TaxID=2856 RepID=A0AAD2G4M8_9STRA|nr:unnamed protein product [Cylindrotheca closterium]